MVNWAEMGKLEKTVRGTCALALSARLMECVRREDVLSAAICGLSAVAALGFEPEDIRRVLAALERSSAEGAQEAPSGGGVQG